MEEDGEGGVKTFMAKRQEMPDHLARVVKEFETWFIEHKPTLTEDEALQILLGDNEEGTPGGLLLDMSEPRRHCARAATSLSLLRKLTDLAFNTEASQMRKLLGQEDQRPFLRTMRLHEIINENLGNMRENVLHILEVLAMSLQPEEINEVLACDEAAYDCYSAWQARRSRESRYLAFGDPPPKHESRQTPAATGRVAASQQLQACCQALMNCLDEPVIDWGNDDATPWHFLEMPRAFRRLQGITCYRKRGAADDGSGFLVRGQFEFPFHPQLVVAALTDWQYLARHIVSSDNSSAEEKLCVGEILTGGHWVTKFAGVETLEEIDATSDVLDIALHKGSGTLRDERIVILRRLMFDEDRHRMVLGCVSRQPDKGEGRPRDFGRSAGKLLVGPPGGGAPDVEFGGFTVEEGSEAGSALVEFALSISARFVGIISGELLGESLELWVTLTNLLYILKSCPEDEIAPSTLLQSALLGFGRTIFGEDAPPQPTPPDIPDDGFGLPPPEVDDSDD